MATGSTEGKEYFAKILVVGDAGVGKTSILKRYVDGCFTHTYKFTMGVDFQLKLLQKENDFWKLQFWDIAGQERFGNMTRVYYRDAIGAIVVCDVKSIRAFETTKFWKNEIDSKVFLLDGSPVDLENDFNEDVDSFCEGYGFSQWFKTSAKTGSGIDEAIQHLVDQISMKQYTAIGENGKMTTIKRKLIEKKRGSSMKNALEALRLRSSTTDELTVGGPGDPISDRELKTLINALNGNSNLRTLILFGNDIKFEGAKILAKFLQENHSLQHVALHWNKIGDEGAIEMALMLEKNTSLRKLSLDSNDIGDEGAIKLGQALEKNLTLQVLWLYENRITQKGIKFISKGLLKNTSLQQLWLGGNKIGDEGSFYLASALEKNRTLQILNLWKNDIGNEGAFSLASSLEKNTSLQYLDLDKNPASFVHRSWDLLIENSQNFFHVRNSILNLLLIPQLKTINFSITSTDISMVTFLDLSFCDLTVIPNEFSKFINLNHLNLNNNILSSLPQSIQSLKKLSKLDLGGNKFLDFPEILPFCTSLKHLTFFRTAEKVINGIHDLSFLTSFILRNCLLTKIPDSVFCLKNLTDLDLSVNKLVSLPEQFYHFASLRSLNLNDNEIEELSDQFLTLKSLLHLHLSHNHLKSLPKDFGELTNLTFIDLSYNFLSNLPFSFTRLSNLETCNLHSNNFSNPPIELRNILKLNSFEFSENPWQFPDSINSKGISTILIYLDFLTIGMSLPNLNYQPEDSRKMIDIIKLDISNCQLESLSKNFLFTSLVYLDISHNNLSSLPSSFQECFNLTQLKLSHNKFSKFPEEICNLPLFDLDLSFNQLTSLPDQFCSLYQLKVLNLEFNNFSPLPTLFSSLSQLKVLDIQNNHFKISKEISSNINKTLIFLELTTLNIFPEKLSFEPLTSRKLSDLTFLSISDTQIPTFQAHQLVSIESLDLSDNINLVIPKGLKFLKKLKVLTLKNNALSDVKINEVIELLTEDSCLEVLDLRNNNLTDSTAKRISSALHQFNFSLKIIYLSENLMSDHLTKEIMAILNRRGVEFRRLPIYLLGFQQSGKSSFRKGLAKSFISTFRRGYQSTSWVEMDRQVKSRDISFQIFDYGGNFTDFQMLNHFMITYRTIFIVFINPFQTDYQHQLWFWFRYLWMKSLPDHKTQVIVVFSHRNKAINDEIIDSLQESLQALIDKLTEEFQSKITISEWYWQNYLERKEMTKIHDHIHQVSNELLQKIRITVPHLLPTKFFENLKDTIYERENLEKEISKILKVSEEIASNWILKLLLTQDFFIIKTQNEYNRNCDLICVDLEKFSKIYLQHFLTNSKQSFLKKSDFQHQFSQQQHFSIPNLFLSLNYCYSLKLNSDEEQKYIPIVMDNFPEEKIKTEFWSQTFPINVGRRLVIDDNCSMFHSTLIPQITCKLFSILHLDNEPLFWSTGFIFKFRECSVALQLLDSYSPGNIFTQSVSLMSNIKTLDILVKGPSHVTSMAVLFLVLDATKDIISQNYTFQLQYFLHFPHNVKQYYFSHNKLNFLTVPLKENHLLFSELGINYLFPPGAEIDPLNNGTTPFFVSCALGRIGDIKKMLNENFDLQTKTNELTGLHIAIQQGHTEIVKELLINGQINMNQVDPYGFTPLFIACVLGHSEIVEILLSDVNLIPTKSEISPLQIACHEGHSQVVRQLLRSNLVSLESESFFFASKNGHLTTVMEILASGREISFSMTFEGKRFLDLIKEENHTDILELLELFQNDPLGTRTILKKELSLPVGPEFELQVSLNQESKTISVHRPFTLEELSMTIKNSFLIKEQVKLEYYNVKLDQFFEIKTLNDLNSSTRIRVIPFFVWSCFPDIRWKVHEEKIPFSSLCIKKSNQILDEECFQKLSGFMAHFRHNDFIINEAHAICNLTLIRNFEGQREVLHGRRSDLPFNKQVSSKISNYEQRKLFLEKFSTFANFFNWNDGTKPFVIPMLHGTSEESVWKICATGLANISTRDQGWFGRGLYTTDSMTYAQQYSSRTEKGYVILLCCVLPGNPFPITEHPFSITESFLGKGCQAGYQSHLTFVDGREKAKAFPSVKSLEVPFLVQELVVFQDSQIVPMFVLYVTQKM